MKQLDLNRRQLIVAGAGAGLSLLTARATAIVPSRPLSFAALKEHRAGGSA